MREIKFRGQRVDTKELVYGHYVEIKLLTDLNDEIRHLIMPEADLTPPIDARVNYIDGDDDVYGIDTCCFEVFPESVGQYTGLKDGTKWEDLSENERARWTALGNMPSEWNGKEIYEGDIVKGFSHTATVLQDAAKNNRKIESLFQVKWNNCVFGEFRLTPITEMNRTFPNPDECKIVGNIYENPELLNKS